MTYDVVVVGGGAAGLSAALILGRARRRVMVCDDGAPRNACVPLMHGFLSRDRTPPAELLSIARDQLKPYPSVSLANETIGALEFADGLFTATASSGTRFQSRRFIIANGVRDELPHIENLESFWGRGVFVCPFCDGWEVQGKRLAVYGPSHDAVFLAQELRGWSDDVTVCIDGRGSLTTKERRWLRNSGSGVLSEPLQRLIGDGKLDALEFANGERLACNALFISAPLRQPSAIAASIGCRIDRDGAIVVDDDNQTNIAGCYAAGDAVLSVHQVLLAAASGARAAIAVCKDLLREEAEALAR